VRNEIDTQLFKTVLDGVKGDVEGSSLRSSHIRLIVSRAIRVVRIWSSVQRLEWQLRVAARFGVLRVQCGICQILVHVVSVHELVGRLRLVRLVVRRVGVVMQQQLRVWLNRRDSDSMHQGALDCLPLQRLSRSRLRLLLRRQVVILRMGHLDMRVRCQGQRCRCRCRCRLGIIAALSLSLGLGLGMSLSLNVSLNVSLNIDRIGERAVFRVHLLLVMSLNVRIYHDGSKGAALRLLVLVLVPVDGQRVLGFGLHLRIHEPDVPTLEVVVRRGVAGERCDDRPNGSGGPGWARCRSGDRRGHMRRRVWV
jgi:hypothetical protein